jgi:hypothetical protein
MRLHISLVTTAILIVVSAAGIGSAAPYKLINTVTHPEPARSNQFTDIKLADDYLLVAAASYSIPGDPSQMFVYDVTGQHLLHTINDPTPTTTGFGGAFAQVAIDGKHVVIANYGGSFTADRLLYVYDAESGLLRHTLTSPIPDHGAFPGGDVAVSGDNLVVGAYSITLGGGNPVYPAAIFIFDAVSGEARHTLSPPAGIVPWEWGDMFDVSGDIIAVGTPNDPNVAALLYNAQSGLQIGTIPDPPINNYDYISIQGDKVLIGKNLGETFLYDTAGNLLETVAYPSNDLFGTFSMLEFSGDNVLIGSSGHYDAREPIAPALWLYDGTSGELLQHFIDAPIGDRYVGMVSNPSGSHIAVRNRNNEVLIYARVPEPPTLALSAIAALLISRCGIAARFI